MIIFQNVNGGVRVEISDPRYQSSSLLVNFDNFVTHIIVTAYYIFELVLMIASLANTRYSSFLISLTYYYERFTEPDQQLPILEELVHHLVSDKPLDNPSLTPTAPIGTHCLT